MKPFFVVGTRPEIIKMAPIIHEFHKRNIQPFLLHTGQHYSDNLSSQFFKDMNLDDPDLNLNIGSGTHSEQTAKALVGIEKSLLHERPDVVLVQGDTNAVLSAALASVKVGIPVAHVEAGLRSYDIRMPEEHNRRLTDHVSSFLFAPTEKSAEILRSERVWGKIFVTGNTIIDALESRISLIREKESLARKLGLREFSLLTMHRAENVDNKETLTGLINGILSLDCEFVYPAHPRTIARMKEFDLFSKVKASKKMHIIEPPGYLEFLALMRDCSFILTDSGGIQEEATAPSINKRVFVLRTSTERPEAQDSGHATLVGVNPMRFPDTIRNAIQQGLDSPRECPYGDGHAARKIVDILQKS